MNVCHLDYETRSGADVTEVGAHRHSIDPRFEILMAGVSRDGEEQVYLWINPRFFTADDLGEDNAQAEKILSDADLIFCHNAPFEQAATWGAFEQRKRTPFAAMPGMDQWRCTAAMARKAGLPFSLQQLSETLGLKDPKDRAGKALIKWFCQPDQDTGKFNEPRDHPDKWVAFCEYCRQDVRAEKEVGQKLKAFELTGSALATFQFDLRMNQRGIPINVTAARNAQRIIDETQSGVVEEFRKLTGLNPTQREKVRALVGLPNMQAPTVEAALADPLLDENDLRVLEMYQLVSYSAVKKVQTMLDCVCPDGRVRGAHMYYGAGTGRWSGKLLQPHNFKKTDPEFRPMIDGIYAALCHGWSAYLIDQLYGPPLESIANCIRNFIQPPEGEILDGDFAQVEARIICWLAGQNDVLEKWRQGEDLYKWMASHVYGIPITEVTMDQREVGKRIMLGCFAYDTPVVTRDGLKPIGEVTSGDWLWDGVDWVQSDGVTFSGCQTTINLHGINVTSNHRVLCDKAWLPAASLARDGSTLFRALETALESFESPAMRSEIVEELSEFVSDARAERQSTTSTPRVFKEASLLGVINAPRNSRTTGVRDTGDMRKLSRMLAFVRGCSTEFPVASLDAIAALTLSGATTEAGESTSSQSGEKTGKNFFATSSASPTTPKLRETSTESTTFEDMNRATSDSPPSARTCSIDDLWRHCKNASLFSNTRCEDSPPIPVYDVANCGPRRRFTIMTAAGPLLVHNCGFQMGWRKFIGSCHDLYQLDVPKDVAKKGIKLFRALCGKIRDYWWILNNSALQTLESRQSCGIFSLRKLAGIPYLLVQLKSGRSLAYPYPEVNLAQWVPEPDDDEDLPDSPAEVKWRKEITYWGQLPMSAQWGRAKLYGGKLAENITQATAADFMAHGAIVAERRGMAPFMLVHDQGLALRDRGQTPQEYEAALGDLPAWAKGFPMKVEAKIAPYYKK